MASRSLAQWAVPAAALAVLLAALVAGSRWRRDVARAGEPAKPEGVAAGVDADLFARSKGFREVLESVRERGEQLARRERELAAREAALRAREGLATFERGTSAPNGPCSTGVARVYQSMSADDAAPIVDGLDDATAKSIFACLTPRQVGGILAAMNRDRAVALTRALSRDSGTR